MKIVVTGTNGFIGGATFRELLALGFDAWPLQRAFASHNCEILKDVDVLIHQAANNNTLSQNSEEMLDANVHDSINLFETAIKCGCKKIIYASTTAVYGNSPTPFTENTKINPLNPYAESKAILDQYIFSKTFPVPIISLRYCNVYGPDEDHKGKRRSMIGQMIDTMMLKKPVKLFEFGEQKRDWIYIDDIVKVNIKALYAETSGIYNIGTGEAHTYNQLYEKIAEHFDHVESVQYIKNYCQSSFQTHTQCDITKAKTELGFKPYFNLEKGIASYIEHKII